MPSRDLTDVTLVSEDEEGEDEFWPKKVHNPRSQDLAFSYYAQTGPQMTLIQAGPQSSNYVTQAGASSKNVTHPNVLIDV